MQLVKHLKHEEMDVRVLTFLNLIQHHRRPGILSPREKARAEPRRDPQLGKPPEKGTIAYKSPPSPLEDYKPLPKAAGLEAAAPRAAPAAAARWSQ